MSNDLAIAACTATIRQLLDEEFRRDATQQTSVMTLPLDKASNTAESTRRLNLFLYHIAPNATWRNQNFPGRGGQYQPPLAVNLYYLLTAYGDGEIEEDDHKLLGRAMTLLHEYSVLTPAVIQRLISVGGPQANTDQPRLIRDADIHEQVDHIRISPEPLSMDEMMKLWGTFHQSPYRISTAYQVSVVLMERRSQSDIPFPVLGRTDQQDSGPNIDARLSPELQRIVYKHPDAQGPAMSAARVGDILTIYGSQLPTRDARIQLTDPLDTNTVTALAELRILPGSTGSKIITRLPPASELVSGRLNLTLVWQNSLGEQRVSNPLQLAIAPSLVADDRAESTAAIVTTHFGDRRALVAILNPKPGPMRKVTLFLTPTDDKRPPRPIHGVTFEQRYQASDTLPTPSQQLAQLLGANDEVAFDVTEIPANRYRVRIRVDLVESLPFRLSDSNLVLDTRQEVLL